MPKLNQPAPLTYRAFFTPMLLLFALIVALEWLGTFFDLFQYHSLGYDKILHFLGGLLCGMFGVFLLKTGYGARVTNISMLLVTLMAAFSIGMLWEILQIIIPAMRNVGEYNWYDTIGDMIFDMMGGVGVGLIYRTQQ